MMIEFPFLGELSFKSLWKKSKIVIYALFFTSSYECKVTSVSEVSEPQVLLKSDPLPLTTGACVNQGQVYSKKGQRLTTLLHKMLESKCSFSLINTVHICTAFERLTAEFFEKQMCSCINSETLELVQGGLGTGIKLAMSASSENVFTFL